MSTTDAAHRTYFSVDFWGSHPDAGNDDCWTGENCLDRAEAEALFDALLSRDDSKLSTPYLRRSFVQDTVYITLSETDLDSAGNAKTVEFHRTERTPNADRIEKRCAKIARREDSEWKREIAMQAGMGLGIEAYNDVMGY